MLFGISVYEMKEYIGTLVTDWLSVDGEWCPTYNSNCLYYKNNSNEIYKITLKNSVQDIEPYQLVENRYIVIPTTNYFNCYDTKTGTKRHWASDYNNRVMYGVPFTTFSKTEELENRLKENTEDVILTATSQNANYEMTGDMITSIEIGAIIYSHLLMGTNIVSAFTPYGAVEGIDFYNSKYENATSTSAGYAYSITNGRKYIDKKLSNPPAIYPISTTGDIRFNPSIFSKFISSYNNKDMVISDGIAYKLEYYNNTVPVIAYYMLNGMEGLENAFVLQSLFYGVSKNKLYEMDYSNGVSVEAICDITNMKFLGALPSKALFWSAQNRAIYTFGGNCIMQLSQYANDLTHINNEWYNTATQELFLDTNIGLLIFSDLGTYCLSDITDVKDIFFFDDYFIININGEEEEYSYYYSYNLLDGYESNKIIVKTKYYGNNIKPIVVNNIYIRLYNQEVQGAFGSLKIKGRTVTDVGYETDEKTVYIGENPDTETELVTEQWDSETDTVLIKYTPKYSRGLGFSLEFETEFPIVDIKFDYVEMAGESQLAHINI